MPNELPSSLLCERTPIFDSKSEKEEDINDFMSIIPVTDQEFNEILQLLMND